MIIDTVGDSTMMGTPGVPVPKPWASVVSEMSAPAHQGVVIGAANDWEKFPQVTMPAPRGDAIPSWWTYSRPQWLFDQVPWFAVMECQGNTATNTYVQIDGITLYNYSDSNRTWYKVVDNQIAWCDFFTVVGSNYVSDADFRGESAGNGGGISCRPAYPNFCHGYSAAYHMPMSGLLSPMDLRATMVTMRCRLVLKNPAGVDDRANAKYIVIAANDFWPGAAPDFNPATGSFPFSPGNGIGMGVLVTATDGSWQNATMLVPNSVIGCTYAELQGDVTKAWPAIFAQQFPQHTVRNYGLDSNATSAMLLAGTGDYVQTFAAQMAASPADLVFIQFGFNDEFTDTVASFKANLTQMVNIASTAPKPKRCVFVTSHPTKFAGMSAYMQGMRDVGALLTVPVIDFNNYMAGLISSQAVPLTAFVPDGVRGNQNTHTLEGNYAASVFPSLTNVASASGDIMVERVAEVTTSIGVGDLALGGALTSYRPFSAVCQPGNNFYGMVVAVDGLGNETGDWETGYYTYKAGNAIGRTRVDRSSNANAAVNWAAGTKRIHMTPTAALVRQYQNAAVVPPPTNNPGGSTGGTGGTGSSGTFTDQFHTAIHAHRVFNGGGSAVPSFQYGVFRHWDVDLIADYQTWKSPGVIDFSVIDQVYAGHATKGAKIIKCFGSVPTWAARVKTTSDVNNFNDPGSSRYGVVGSMSGPADLNQFEQFVTQYVTHTQQYLWAVEGWNEPFNSTGSTPYEFFTGTPTQLADIQQRIWRATKAVNPNILVFSPPQAYMDGIDNVILDAMTSDGHHIWEYFDVLSWHPYTYTADGVGGTLKLSDAVATIKGYMAKRGLNKPLADTEHGFFQFIHPGGQAIVAMTQQQKADVLTNLFTSAKSLGLLCVALYSYDDGLTEGQFDFSPGMPVALAMQSAYTNIDTKTYPPPTTVSTPPGTGTGGTVPGGTTGGSNNPPPVTGGSVRPLFLDANKAQLDALFGGLMFQDEFDGTKLDPTKWKMGDAFGRGAGGTVDLVNSMARLWVKGEVGITTTVDFAGGYFEARCQVPTGPGTWPAFWLLQHTGGNATRSEVDMFEMYPGMSPDRNSPVSAPQGGIPAGDYDFSVHPVSNADGQGDPGATHFTVHNDTLSTAMHTYGVHWRKDGQFDHYLDGRYVGSTNTIAIPYSNTMCVIFDIYDQAAIGGPSMNNAPQGPNNALLIDYFRAWSEL